jgi:hypothetical protein
MMSTVWAVAWLLAMSAVPVSAQARRDIGVRGFGMFGNMTFTATDTFEAVLDRTGGPIFGGGGQVLLPWDRRVAFQAGWRARVHRTRR